MPTTKKTNNPSKPKAAARQGRQVTASASVEDEEVSSGDDLVLTKASSNKNGKRTQTAALPEAENKGKGRAKKNKTQQTSSSSEADEVIMTEGARGTGERDGNPQLRAGTTELSQKVSRLLSQEPIASSATYHQAPVFNLKAIPTIEDEGVVIKDKQIAILEEKIKRFQKEITQLRDSNEAKDKLFDEYRQLRETEPEQQLLRHKSEAEAALKTKESIIVSQAEEVVKCQRTVTELHAKLARIASGEEDRIRQQLEQEKQELFQANEQLRVDFDAQRRRRKEAERESKRARLSAEEAVQERLEELAKEANTSRKMLEEEINHSKGLIAQINQLRGVTSQNVRTGGPSTINPTSNAHVSRTTSGSSEATEDLKAKLNVIADFTGFQILSVAKNNKGKIYDCLVTDLCNAHYNLNFKLQFHQDDTCSYEPSLDPTRDFRTISVLPDYLKGFARFEKESQGPFFMQLFKAFNVKE
ncbi:hypothetical protein CROQUDRAFT_652986 [Cronartium quercuum f. sp. fusiforme G11]|uniref:Monopolin complex subunit Csm1/Pcs1 C-terminal domain-containing protein n=1 Tax=Cronartium quercuum f. sp. fusiforme G11 TaxID=708437 RepID=A0A9P6NTG6_9BASI|nr:hypothetical protein CROQUDRAFT_652986 [Cronartium quercuum f. sp. fusiforme G11]